MRLVVAFFFMLTLAACETGPPPLDTADRLRIDSTSAAQIRAARLEIDSLCREESRVRLPLLIDSLRAVRQREIEEKLRSVPR